MYITMKALDIQLRKHNNRLLFILMYLHTSYIYIYVCLLTISFRNNTEYDKFIYKMRIYIAFS
jgi:hypothetical protein